jgi:hypothetical protein
VSILDTFYLLFKSDTTEVDKGLDKASKGAKGLLDNLKAAEGGVVSLNSAILSMAGKAAAVLGVGLSLKSIVDGVKETAAANFELAKLADRFHSTADAIDEFQDAGELLGLSNEQTIGGLKELDKAVQDTALGLGRAKKVFEEIGIEVTDSAGKVKPVTTVMAELQAKLKDMETGKRIRVMERLGLDPALMKLFNADMGDLQRRMAAVDSATGFSLDKAVKRSQDYTKASKAMSLETKTLGMFFSKLRESFDVAIMPLFTKGLELATQALKFLVNFVLNNGKLVEGVFVAIATAVMAFAVPAMIRLAIATVAATWPYLLMAAAVIAIGAAFALVYDDIMNFIEGNDSLIGQMTTKYPVILDIVNGLVDAFKWFASVVSDVTQIIMATFMLVFNTIADIGQRTFAQFSGATSLLGDTFKALGDLVGGVFQTMIDWVSKFLDKFGGIVGIAKSVGGAISGALGFIKKELKIPDTPGDAGPRQEGGASGPYGVGGGLAAGKEAPPAVPGLAAGKEALAAVTSSNIGTRSSAALTSSATTNKNTTVNVGAVNVQTAATDAAGISKSIGDTVGAQMRQAASNYDDGVAA